MRPERPALHKEVIRNAYEIYWELRYGTRGDSTSGTRTSFPQKPHELSYPGQSNIQFKK